MRTDALIRDEGMKALRKHLGLVEAEKFISLLRREDPFDYTEWQQTLWQGQSVNELFAAAKKYENEENSA
ncbi:MAG: hypothetical protein GY862_09640 [Gammaproteobacteria bacterium]|nr:hypothetical protein [Gammaproteobacteria bacterium]